MYRVTLYKNENDKKGLVIHTETVGRPKIKKGKINQGINQIDMFDFELTYENVGYGKIRPMRTLVDVVNTQNNYLEFKGRVVGYTDTMTSEGLHSKRVICENELGYLHDSHQPYFEFTGMTRDLFVRLIENHNAEVEPHKRYEIGTVSLDHNINERGNAKVHRFTWGDTLNQVAETYGVSVDDLKKFNDIEDPDMLYPGDTIVVRKKETEHETGSTKTYRIVWGDTLSELAVKFGVPMQQLVKDNNIKNPDLIYAGDNLRINTIVKKTKTETQKTKGETEIEIPLQITPEESTFDALFKHLINEFGGELQVRHEGGVRYIDYVDSIGHVSPQKIELSKNLMSVTKKTDPTNIITRLKPLGSTIENENKWENNTRVTIESVNGGKDYIDHVELQSEFGIKAGSKVFDDVDEPSEVKKRGREHLNEQRKILQQFTVEALDLFSIDKGIESFDVGNTYDVKNPVMAINEMLRVVGKSTDIVIPINSTLTIGDKLKSLLQYQAEANKGARMAKELESRVVQLSEVNRGLSRSLTKTRDDLQDLVRRVEENPVEELKIPAYYRDHVNDKINTVNNLQSVDGFNRFSFGFITDMHIQTNQRHSAVMMREFVNRTNLSVVINGGDQISNSGSTTKSTAIGWIRELMDMVTPIKSLMMNTMGNHDDNSITKQWNHTLKEPEIYSELFRYMGNRSVSGANGKYHYRDDFFNKVRYIVLDSHDVPYIQEGNGLKYTGQWDYVFRQEQLDWFANVALDTPNSDWSVVVASHVPVYDDGIMTGFDYPVANADLARGILKAYKEKTTYANSSASGVVTDFQADVSVDFTSKGGDVIVWLAGHTHYDNVVQLPEGIPMVTTLCDSSLQWSDAPFREIGTISEHAFDVVTVDKANRQIYMTRVGAGESRQVGY